MESRKKYPEFQFVLRRGWNRTKEGLAFWRSSCCEHTKFLIWSWNRCRYFFFLSCRRTSSRVLARPGGTSSLTFGILPSPSPKKQEKPEPEDIVSPQQEDEKTAAQNEKEEAKEPVTTSKTETETPAAVPPEAPKDATRTTPALAVHVPHQPTPSSSAPAALLSTNAFVSGNNMNGGMTMAGGGRPSSRVLAPPGGHTSIKLG